MSSCSARRQSESNPLGFTLIETSAILVIFVMLFGAITPTLAQIRSDARAATSTANLMQIGQARDQYAADNKDRIYTYTWRAGETYTMPDGTTRTEFSEAGAVNRQNQEIIMRRTGRISGQFKISYDGGRLPHKRFTNLILMDYMAGDDDDLFPNPVFADPEDGDLLNWQEHQLDYNGIPYPITSPGGQGYEPGAGWLQRSARQRWAFGTSYYSTPFAWQLDGLNGEPVAGPVVSSPHYLLGAGDFSTGRYMNQVLFPSKKVHLFEEFDREQKRQPYFAYDHAKPEKLMFDGSINTQVSGEAHSSVSPLQPGQVWLGRYVPFHVFPIPVDGLGSNQLLNMRYMWTDDGLQGVDYD